MFCEITFGSEVGFRANDCSHLIEYIFHLSYQRELGAGTVEVVVRTGGSFLPLYDEQLPLPALLLPPSIEACLPKGVNRGQLLSVLWEHGALRPGQVTVRLEVNRAE